MVLDCLAVLQDVELEKSERILTALIIFYDGVDTPDELQQIYEAGDLEAAVKEMYRFFNCGMDESPGMAVDYKLVDWKQDEQILASAINSVANNEVRSVPYLHWWTFLGYYTAIGECPFSFIISIRFKMIKGEKLEKYENEYKRNNPQYFTWNSKTLDQQEADEYVKQIWNNVEG